MRTRTALMKSCTLGAAESSVDGLYIRQTHSLRVSLNLAVNSRLLKSSWQYLGTTSCPWLSTHIPRVVQYLNEYQSTQYEPVKKDPMNKTDYVFGQLLQGIKRLRASRIMS